MISKMIKIHEKTILVAIKMETRKRKQQKESNKNIQELTEHVENGPRNGGPDMVIFWSSGSFFSVPDGGSQGLPQEPPRPVQASISIDWSLMLAPTLSSWCLRWATFYVVCLITFLVTSSFHFQISGHKFKCVGVVRRGQ